MTASPTSALRRVRAALAGLFATLAATLLLTPAPLTQAAQDGPAPPINGMRQADLRTHVIRNATVIPAPGEKMEKATIVIRDGAIAWVGSDAQATIPPGAQTWNAEGLTVYAGLIESALLMSPATPTNSAGAHWNAKIRPEIAMHLQPPPDRAARRELRSMGFTAAAVYPDSGELRGTGALLALADEDNQVRAYRDRTAMAAAFDYGFGFRGGPPPAPATPPSPSTPTPGTPAPSVERGAGGGGGGYPSSLMGAVALMRQTLLDAQWRRDTLGAWSAHPQGHEPPPPADGLDALHDVIAGRQPMLFDCRDEQTILRADRIAREFNVNLWILGCGLEFRRLGEIVALKRPLVVPVDYPQRPQVGTLAQAEAQSLADLMTWEQAPTNARRLVKAGATVALTTHRLRAKTDFPANVRSAIKHGLSADDALAALTTAPARLLGVDDIMGTIEAGKVANLVVVKGSLFEEDAKVRDVWVNGRRSEISADPRLEVKGKGALTLHVDAAEAGNAGPVTVEIDTSRPSVAFVDADGTRTAARGPALSGDLLSWTIDGAAVKMPGGFVRFGGAIEKTDSGFVLTGNAALADGRVVPFTIDITPGEVGAGDDGERRGGNRGERARDAAPGGEAGGGEAGGGDADPVTGEWSIAVEEMPDVAVSMSLKLNADGSVTGTATIMGETMPINSGRYDAASRTLTLQTPTPTGQSVATEVKLSSGGGAFTGTAETAQGVTHIHGAKAGAQPEPSPQMEFAPRREPETDDPPTTTAPAEARPDENPDQPAGQRPGRRGRGMGGRGAGGGPRAGGAAAAGGADDVPFEMPPEQLNSPFGDYGLSQPPQPQTVLLTNATIWTSGPDGIINNGWMLVRDGKIAAIGDEHGWESASAGEVPIIDCAGKHITPGLIDCHSHTGIDGGVNEGTQANTAECPIWACIDPDDINWYRQLAGGLTACNQLHGSANPIGGQNSVVKLKWGHPASAFPIADAIPGIKFALGENVKRSTSRYPNTRMGVETFIRDAFTAAKDYRARWQAWNALGDAERAARMPPRRDLEMDTLVEILEGKRLVHCHSYRQDEILMLIRVADEFGFTIGTFQHVLEGYKVADAIAKHGAGASSFSDWWAYKMEVIDAIPYNGALMNNVGCVVSFNSDSDELARRMNAEAAKAVRYGGMQPAEALKFVTINPARQLRIDHRTGSLEQGKDADFVIWSGDPLSTYTRCEQTWIEGARHFDIADDLAMRAEVDRERQRIIQKILKQANGEPAKPGAATQTSPDSQPASRPGTLLARMLQQREEWIDEQLRLGRDPDEMRPGDCGCNSLDMIYINYGGEQ